MDNKSKTKIDQYLQWPMKLMLFLVPADILIFFSAWSAESFWLSL